MSQYKMFKKTPKTVGKRWSAFLKNAANKTRRRTDTPKPIYMGKPPPHRTSAVVVKPAMVAERQTPDSWIPLEAKTAIITEANRPESSDIGIPKPGPAQKTGDLPPVSQSECTLRVQTKKKCQGKILPGNTEIAGLLLNYLYNDKKTLNLNADHAPFLGKNITCDKLQNMMTEFLNYADCAVFKRIRKITLLNHDIGPQLMNIVPFMFDQLPNLKEIHIGVHPSVTASLVQQWQAQWAAQHIHLHMYKNQILLAKRSFSDDDREPRDVNIALDSRMQTRRMLRRV